MKLSMGKKFWLDKTQESAFHSHVFYINKFKTILQLDFINLKQRTKIEKLSQIMFIPV